MNHMSRILQASAAFIFVPAMAHADPPPTPASSAAPPSSAAAPTPPAGVPATAPSATPSAVPLAPSAPSSAAPPASPPAAPSATPTYVSPTAPAYTAPPTQNVSGVASAPAPAPSTPTPPVYQPGPYYAPAATYPTASVAGAADAGTTAGASLSTSRTFITIEAGAAFDGAARFPANESARSVEEAIDSTLGIAAWVGSRRLAFGLAFERIGLGKDHYATDGAGQVLDASYLVDTLWLGGRYYFSQTRPAVYVTGQVGPALPEARATGTRQSSTPLAAPPSPYQCSDSGTVGVGFAAAIGAEFDVARDFSLLTEAKATAHALSQSGSAFNGCAPGTGAAVGGSVGLRLAYRFGL